MKTLRDKLMRLLAVTGLGQANGYQHYVTGVSEQRYRIPGAPLYVQRAVMQTNFAYRMSEARGGAFDDTVERAADALLSAIEKNGAIGREHAEAAEAILLPLSAEAKRYTVHMIAHAHIDMNWMWPYHETVAVTLETFRTVLKLMDEFPGFTYAQSQASTYEIVERFEPEMLEEIRKRVHEGRWEVSASTWVEADKNMPSSESMARHLLYTKRYLSKLLDIDPETLDLDFEPDTFGHGANVPEILQSGGVKYYYYCRGRAGGGAHIWRAPSGAEVLAYQEPTWYLGDVNPNFALYVPGFCRDTGVMDAIKVYGVGDHGGGPTRQDLTYIEEMRLWPVFPRLEYSTYRAFFAALEKVRDTLPVAAEELNCVFTGCYTTQTRIKLANRTGEAMLGEAEALSAAAKTLAGGGYRAAAFEAGWRRVLFSQFHDILTGSGVRDTREYAMGSFSETMAYAGTEYAAAMRALAGAIDTSRVSEIGSDALTRAEGAGVGFDCMRFRPPVCERGSTLTRVFHLFNAVDAAREVPSEITMWDYPGDLKTLSARTLDGKPVPVQLVSAGNEGYMGHEYARLLLDAPVPAFGWQTVVLEPDRDTPFDLPFPRDPRRHAAPQYVLENEFLRAEFSPTTAMLVSLVDKANGREMLSSPAGFFDILEEENGMSSWAVTRYLRRRPIDSGVRMEVVTDGGLRKAIRMRATFAGASSLEYTVSLDKGARCLTYQVQCDWRERGSWQDGIPQLAFAAPFAYASDATRYDNAAGFVDRPPQYLDVPALTYACALNRADGGSLFMTSNAKYGLRTFDGILQMTLVRGAFNPDYDPETGRSEFALSLGVAGDVSPAHLKRMTAIANRPAGFITARPHKGTLAGEAALAAGLDDAVITAVKLAEDGKGLVVRAENCARADSVRLLVKLPVKAAYASDALEKKGAPLQARDGAWVLPCGGKGFNTAYFEL